MGTPPQQVRVLPSTSGDHNALWIVLTQGCTPQDPSNCPQTRTVFNSQTSSTWQPIGLYQLGLREEAYLGYNASADNAEFANETFTLGNNNGLPTIQDSVIQGFATKDFYMGALGLAARAINVTNFNEPQPSVLQALRNQGSIPSLSWGYTAGSQNTDPPTFGSLTLGGYDSSRMVPNSVTVSFGTDQSRDLLIGLQSISDGSTQLLSTGVYAFIDSLVSELWLPQDACEAFERAFGLVWNDTAELYLVNDSLHDTLVSQNPSFYFQLGPATSSSYGSVQVVLPYSAFDLSVSPPYVSTTSRYFPLKRAQNSTQYTLGRAFLQYAYVVADYERSQFSVSQALFPPTSIPQNLTAIYPTGQGTGGTSNSKKSGISAGAIAGIVVGVVILIFGGLLVCFLRRRKTKKTKLAELPADSAVRPREPEQEQPYEKAELDATGPFRSELGSELETKTKAELDAANLKGHPALDSRNTSQADFGEAYEMDSMYPKSNARNELPGSPGNVVAHELPAEDVIVPELHSVPISLHGSPSSSQWSPRFPPGPRSGMMHQSSTASRSSSGAPQSSVMHQSSTASHSSAGTRSPPVQYSSSAAASSDARHSSATHHTSIISPVSEEARYAPIASRSSPSPVTRSPPVRQSSFRPNPPPK